MGLSTLPMQAVICACHVVGGSESTIVNGVFIVCLVVL